MATTSLWKSSWPTEATRPTRPSGYGRPRNGVIRHVDDGCEEAIEVAKTKGVSTGLTT